MINIISDLHTHTRYSHGKGSVEDNVKAAIDKGLQAIAIADHGFGHMFYSIPDVRRYLDDIHNVRAKYQGEIDVLSNVELNLTSLTGDLDMPDGYADCFDLMMFGYHKLVKYRSGKDALYFFLPRAKKPEAMPQNTQAYITAINKNKVDIISHPGYGLPINKIDVAKAAATRGTALEINAKHPEFTVEELQKCAKTGVKFVIDSDAHTPGQVGVFTAAVQRAQQAGLTASQIINAAQE